MTFTHAVFYARKTGWFSWQVYSKYPDLVERLVFDHRFWSWSAAQRAVQAVNTHYLNGFDMGKAVGSARPMGA